MDSPIPDILFANLSCKHHGLLSLANGAGLRFEGLPNPVAGKRYFNPNTNPSVAEAVEHWIETKRGTVNPQTISGYRPLLKIIVGPLRQGTPQERAHYALTGKKRRYDTKLLEMHGPYKVSEFTTAQLRRWHNPILRSVKA